MSEGWLIFFLSVMSVCLTTMTVTLLVTARDLRATLRRLHDMLPRADRTLQEAHHSLRLVRQLLIRADDSTRRIEAVLARACEASLEVFDQFARWRQRTQRFFTKQFGNGSRGEPRPQDRHGWSRNRGG